MSNIRQFSALNTKLRVMRRDFLDDNDYISLMKRKSVEEQLEYLKNNTVYNFELSKIENFEKIESIELELHHHLVNVYEKIIRYLNDDYKLLFKTLMLRYEIEDLKLYLRAMEKGEDISKVKNLRIIKDKYYSFNLEKIKSSKNLDEFIENLRDTIYYDALNPYKKEKHAKLIFYMEMNLDILYFKLLKSHSKLLKDKDRKIFDEILGRNEDLLNIEWIYRGIKFYSLLPEELLNFTLPDGYEFNYKDLKKMSYYDLEDLKSFILKTPYKFLFDSEKDIDLYMERRVQRYLYFKFLNYIKKAKLDIGLSLSFIHLLEYEIRDIISMLEAKKYGLSLEETKDYLVRKVKGSD